MQLETWHAAALLAALVSALVTAELFERRGARALMKTLASLTFVGAGALLLRLDTSAGGLLMVGLVLSLVGDLALLAKGNKPLFLLGLGAFLAAHLCYAAAFWAHGVDGTATWVAGAVLLGAGVPLSAWLSRHVRGSMRAPVAAYVVAISVMVALAAGAFGDGGRATLVVGAVLFYLSDLCVARERFVAPSKWNGIFGLPLYYAGQLYLIDGMHGAFVP